MSDRTGCLWPYRSRRRAIQPPPPADNVVHVDFGRTVPHVMDANARAELAQQVAYGLGEIPPADALEVLNLTSRLILSRDAPRAPMVDLSRTDTLDEMAARLLDRWNLNPEPPEAA